MLNKFNLAVSEFVSKNASRYTLNSILVTQDETVATDGHRLVRVSVDKSIAVDQFPVKEGAAFTANDDYKPFLLPADTAKAIVKAIPRKSTLPALSCVAIDGKATDSNGDAHLAVNDLETFQPFTVRKPEGQFPNWQAVMPKVENAKFTIAVNAKYLAELARAAAAFVADEPNQRVVLRFDTAERAMRMDCERDGGAQTWTGVLMPVKL